MILAGVQAAIAQNPLQVPLWVQDAVFYQIFPERFANGDTTNDPPGTEHWGGKPTPTNYFGGDLQGIIDHLEYIKSLGVNAIYLNPVFASSTNHKYHASDYMKIDPHFGDDRVFKTLVDRCHERGIRIILDAVFNHTGVDFFAFQDIKREGARSKFIGWYNVYSLPLGPPSKPNYECWWGNGDLPKLMTTNPGVRRYLFDVTAHWMQFGIDGWRLDVPNEIPHDFWIAWRTLVKSLNPDAYIVGEIWDNGKAWLGGDQFDAVMNYRFRDACVRFFAKREMPPSRFDSLLARQRADYSPEVDGALQNLLGSHDTERFLTLCSGDTASLKLAVLFQMTYPGAPMVYYGDEVGMSGGRDPGCRGTMVWNPLKQDRALLEFYKRVIALRMTHTPLRRGTMAPLMTDDRRGIYAFLREDGKKAAVVILNTGEKPRRLSIAAPAGYRETKWSMIWPRGKKGSAGTISLLLPKRAGAIFVGERE